MSQFNWAKITTTINGIYAQFVFDHRNHLKLQFKRVVFFCRRRYDLKRSANSIVCTAIKVTFVQWLLQNKQFPLTINFAMCEASFVALDKRAMLLNWTLSERLMNVNILWIFFVASWVFHFVPKCRNHWQWQFRVWKRLTALHQAKRRRTERQMQ